MKKTRKNAIVLSLFLIYSAICQAQKETTISNTDTVKIPQKVVHGLVAANVISTSNNQVPLWMRGMQNGSLPLSGISTSVLAGTYKSYTPNRQQKLFDWSAGLNIRGNAGKELEFYLIEAYAKARLSIFQITAGRVKEISGLVDSTFSTGAFSISGNALSVPKVELSTHGYREIHFTHGLLAFKGSYAHGWFGDRLSSEKFTQYDTDTQFTTYFHQKTLYGRLGKPNWNIHFYGGFNDQVMWGSEQKMYPDYGLSKWEIYQYVVLGKAYSHDQFNSKVGNHVGSIDQALELNFKQLLLFAYHQFYYEAGALAKLANIKDGTWGLSLKNTTVTSKCFTWHKILFEFIYSKSQGGELDGPSRPSPVEDYYNNNQYVMGWTYKEENMGNILFTSKKYIREDLPNSQKIYIVNNRIIAFHTAIDFSIDSWRFNTRLTLSKNFGNYDNTPAHRGVGNTIIYHDPPYFGQVNQFNGYFEASRPLKNGWILNMALANDYGDLLYNSSGGYLKVVKKW